MSVPAVVAPKNNFRRIQMSSQFVGNISAVYSFVENLQIYFMDGEFRWFYKHKKNKNAIVCRTSYQRARVGLNLRLPGNRACTLIIRS